MNYNFSRRIQILSLCIFAFSLILVSKLFYVQVVHSSDYKEQADRQYATPTSDIFDRGNIYFSKKDGGLISAATLVSGFKVAIRPKEITDAEAMYKQIASITPLDHDGFIQKAGKKADPYEEILNHLTKEQADALNALDLSGVYVYKEKWRFYPGETLGSHALGFVGFKGKDYSGRYGVEKYYNDVLSRAESNLYVNFFAEVFSNIKNTIFKGKHEEGDIVTTIEPVVQNYVEKMLAETREKWSAAKIGAVVIDPMTGEIYALASDPGFNLNEYSKAGDASIYSNPFTENVFELGSIIKPLTMAAGLDAGVVTPTTTYHDAGFLIIDKKQINNFDKKGRGTVNMQDVLNQSLNTGVVFVERKLGKENLRKYFLDFGFNEKTGIDLPNETTGLVSNIMKSNREIEYATASFGQGIAVTPLEATRAFSSLANGGYLITPHVAREIRYADGGTKVLEYPPGRQVIKKETSEAITKMLVTVLDRGYSEGKLKLDHYGVAVKTGTAQMAKENGGGYYEDKNLHSFFGYFPASQPRFLVMMFIVDPKGVKYSSQTLLPPFMDTAKFLLNYYEVAPDR